MWVAVPVKRVPQQCRRTSRAAGSGFLASRAPESVFPASRASESVFPAKRDSGSAHPATSMPNSELGNAFGRKAGLGSALARRAGQQHSRNPVGAGGPGDLAHVPTVGDASPGGRSHEPEPEFRPGGLRQMAPRRRGDQGCLPCYHVRPLELRVPPRRAANHMVSERRTEMMRTASLPSLHPRGTPDACAARVRPASRVNRLEPVSVANTR